MLLSCGPVPLRFRNIEKQEEKSPLLSRASGVPVDILKTFVGLQSPVELVGNGKLQEIHDLYRDKEYKK